MLHDIDSISAQIPQLQSISMISIEDVSNLSTTGLTPFSINAYETTFDLWYEVVEWAEDNDFTFIKKGEAGNTGVKDSTQLYAYLPVTSLHPADIFVWCNALSVKRGLTPVYYKDAECTEVLKSAADISSEDYITDATDHYDITTGEQLVVYDFSIVTTFYQNKSADGYRLPTVAEWQYAAQGARRTKEDRNYTYAGSNDYTEVAACSGIKIPGSLKPNGIGAYDMSGNVCEYSVDDNSASTDSVIAITDSCLHCYGGHYLEGSAQTYSVQKLYDLKSIINLYQHLFGFRLARSIVTDDEV